MAIAQEKMTNVCLFLERHTLPPTPLNYQVAYTYISKINPNLNSSIDRALATNNKIDCVFIEQLYFEFINIGHNTEVNLIKNVDHVITSLSKNAQVTSHKITEFAGHVRECVHTLDENNIKQSKQALLELNKQTAVLLAQHKQFKQQLQRAVQLHSKSKEQLSKLRKLHTIDLQTGLYKRHYLTQQTQLWTHQEKSVCAIAIHIDNLDDYNHNFGDSVTEVILNKVAKQVHKYVLQSGLPGRTAQDQFTVILADIDSETANIIAEKVKTGVEKLSFKSAKNGQSLPPISLSLGIAQQSESEAFNQLARRASLAAYKAKSLGESSFTAGH
ncbi:GGDEF domain-containing protein [Pseudoalteromonas sp. MMG010]|uniref:GGDEF domain-containing protein n=1 Tax=Pseudoalteromonas sp. MMG010 TaxID=2822685 RepID=UPI001B3A45F4|nr:GGDEF domain-containing protein [Pseudoalteromonas sp. MMG010]MBQ4834492.1 GGDEF domain-containing protein [Pseudoalteromonas sp. MMG010]